MIGGPAFINGLLAEISRDFPQLEDKCQDIYVESPVSSHYHPYNYLTDVIDVTLRASGHWVGTWTGAGDFSAAASTENRFSVHGVS